MSSGPSKRQTQRHKTWHWRQVASPPRHLVSSRAFKWPPNVASCRVVSSHLSLPRASLLICCP
jgi:hypothetical protein